MDSTIVPHDTFCNVIEEAVSAVEGRQTQPRPAAPVPSPPSHTSGPRASRGLVKQIVDNAFKQGGTVFLDPYGGRGEPALGLVASNAAHFCLRRAGADFGRGGMGSLTALTAK